MTDKIFTTCRECGAPKEVQHGKASMYRNHDCRCPDCTEAVRLDNQRRRKNC